MAARGSRWAHGALGGRKGGISSPPPPWHPWVLGVLLREPQPDRVPWVPEAGGEQPLRWLHA